MDTRHCFSFPFSAAAGLVAQPKSPEGPAWVTVVCQACPFSWLCWRWFRQIKSNHLLKSQLFPSLLATACLQQAMFWLCLCLWGHIAHTWISSSLLLNKMLNPLQLGHRSPCLDLDTPALVSHFCAHLPTEGASFHNTERMVHPAKCSATPLSLQHHSMGQANSFWCHAKGTCRQRFCSSPTRCIYWRTIIIRSRACRLFYRVLFLAKRHGSKQTSRVFPSAFPVELQRS